MSTQEKTKPELGADPQGRLEALVMRCRVFEADQEPDGCTAIQMSDVSGLCDYVERLETALATIKKHMKIVNPTGYKMSGVYVLACKGLPDA